MKKLFISDTTAAGDSPWTVLVMYERKEWMWKKKKPMRKGQTPFNGLSANGNGWILVHRHFATSSIFYQRVEAFTTNSLFFACFPLLSTMLRRPTVLMFMTLGQNCGSNVLYLHWQTNVSLTGMSCNDLLSFYANNTLWLFTANLNIPWLCFCAVNRKNLFIQTGAARYGIIPVFGRDGMHRCTPEQR